MEMFWADFFTMEMFWAQARFNMAIVIGTQMIQNFNFGFLEILIAHLKTNSEK